MINELTSSEWLLVLAEMAIEAYTEVIETVRDITGFADRVAGHVDDNVGAARAEDTHSTFDVGVGGVVLPTHDGVVEGGDVGVEVLVADGDGDVYVIDGEERVGIVCQLTSDVVEVIVLCEGNAGQGDGIAGIFDSGAGDGEMERVAQFLVVECDEGLVEPSAGQGIPLQPSATANNEPELVTAKCVGIGEHLFDGIVVSDFLGQESDHGGGGGGEGVAIGIADDDELEDAVGISQHPVAWHAVVDGLPAGGEIAFGFSFALGIGKLPAVDQIFGGREAIVVAPYTLPCQQMN